MKSISTLEPLELVAHWERAETINARGWQWIPYVNVLTLALGLVLLSSHWLCPPGFPVTVPAVAQSMSYQYARPFRESITIDADLRIFFNHRLYDFTQLEQVFRAIPESDGTLLLKADGQVPLSKVLELTSFAKTHGWTSVQLAVNASCE